MIWLIGAIIVAYHFGSWAVFLGLFLMGIGLEAARSNK